jgi:hypothetical protein
VANVTRFTHREAGLIVQSKDGDYEAFLSFSADEIYAMMNAEEGMPMTVVCPLYMHL